MCNRVVQNDVIVKPGGKIAVLMKGPGGEFEVFAHGHRSMKPSSVGQPDGNGSTCRAATSRAAQSGTQERRTRPHFAVLTRTPAGRGRVVAARQLPPIIGPNVTRFGEKNKT